MVFIVSCVFMQNIMFLCFGWVFTCPFTATRLTKHCTNIYSCLLNCTLKISDLVATINISTNIQLISPNQGGAIIDGLNRFRIWISM